MANTFDFELTADDNASREIAHIELALNKLRPTLTDVRGKLQLGHNETTASLGVVGDKIRDIAEFARQGSQRIGDMIPPLKNVGELSGKYLGLAAKVGGIGAVGYLGGQFISQLPQEAQKATDITNSAKSSGMTVAENTRLTGTLIQRGVDENTARGSIESYYNTLNAAIRGNNNELLAAIRSMGGEIIKGKEDKVDLTSTLRRLEVAIKTVPTYRNAELKQKWGLDNDLLGLLREGKLNERLAMSDKTGLTRDDETIEKLNRLDTQLNALSATWTGRKTQFTDTLNRFFADDSVVDILGGVQDMLTYGPDNAAIMKTLGFSRNNEADILRWAYNTPEFYQQLGTGSQIAIDFGLMTDEIQKAYAKWQKQHPQVKQRPSPLGDDIPVPDGWVQDDHYDPYRRGFRNHNPGNLTAAPNTTGHDYGNGHVYAQFANMHDGLAAMSRQLMLDADKGINRIDELVKKYAPRRAGNNTASYIRMVSGQTGFHPSQALDLHDPAILSSLMNAMIKMENGQQPFSYRQVMAGIHDAIENPRWAGLRNPDKLQAQREKRHNRAKVQSALFSNDTDPQDNSQIISAMTKALTEALQSAENKATLEITLVNGDTGQKQLLTTQPTGRVTTAMQYP